MDKTSAWLGMACTPNQEACLCLKNILSSLVAPFFCSSVSGTRRRVGAPRVRRTPWLPGAPGLKLLGGSAIKLDFFRGGGAVSYNIVMILG